MRVNDLSKELGVANKELVAFLKEQGAEVKSHMSNVTDEQAQKVRDRFGEPKPEPEKPIKVDKPIKREKPVKSSKAEEIEKASKPIKVDRPVTKEKPVQENADTGDDEPKKKKLTAVFRPQNAQQPRKPVRQKVDPSMTGRVITVAKKEEKPAPEPEPAPVTMQAPVQEKTESPASVKEEKPLTAETAEPVKEEAKAPADQKQKPETHKAPLVEGRDRVTTFGNVFANQPKKEKTPASSGQNANQKNNRDNRDGNRYNRDGRYQRPDRNQNQQGSRPNQQGKDGQPERKPVRFENRNNQKPNPARPGQAPAGATNGAFGGKKTNNNKQGKNNYKDKSDKKHRTEDGPINKGGKVSRHPFIKPETVVKEQVDEDIKEIIIPETINIKDLAGRLKLQPAVIVKKLFLKGELVNVNTELSFEQAEEIALEYDVICTMEEKVDVIAELLKEAEEDENDMVTRPPVVCVMGHVDHGKTSLLDKIRATNVTSREAGGITQAIGAYQVRIGDRMITFLDTPGHEAFTAMRMRGAQATDIAVLVVAADDGVMPQTVEAINHAKAAGVDIVVAVNKIDKPAANIDRVKQELSEYELIPEDWGGTTAFCPVSAKTGEGIEDLLEMIILTADVKELKANPNRLARGIVIEAELDKGRGPVATVLVQKGTLHVGDFVAAGACSGKVRAMINDKGQRVKEATPSTPVEILGLSAAPNAGEVFVACESDKEAKDFAATFVTENKKKLVEDTKAKMSLDDLFDQIKAGNVKELPIIVKADVQGSVEAVKQSLLKLSNDEVQVKVIHGGVGAINESDVALASASNTIIIGFNVGIDPNAKPTAESEKVDIRLYTVIYNAIEDIEHAMKGMLAPVYEEKIIGHAEIRMVFKASGVGSIAGSYVLDGMFQRGCKARITREGEQIFEGNVASLKRFKDDVKEVKAGYECGLVFDGFNEIREGDQIEGYIMVEVPRE
ncbi:MAG: translation initiation factor IF-2 [Lachnospiraceae bacterium]|nr:translation initiation factor IF-2 [Lachnospiraceae bacterium]